MSSEVYWNYETQTEVFPRVLKAIAFLGADIPAVTDLKSVEALFKRTVGGAVYAYDNGHQYRVYDIEHRDYHEGLSLGDYLTMVPRVEKTSANYSTAEGEESCGACKYFIPHMSACSVVEGFILPNGTSDLFEPKFVAEPEEFADDDDEEDDDEEDYYEE